MGMNVPGEIRRLTDIAEPDVGLITNIQAVHLEGMGSVERIKQEKGELFRRMRKDGTILVNRDDPGVNSLAEEFSGKKITFGVAGPVDVMAREIRIKGEGTSFQIILGGEEEMEVTLPFLGTHFVLDALSAVAAASLFGIDLKKAKEVLEHLHPSPMRMEIRHLEGGEILINDAYNANPTSMELALKTVAEVKGSGRAIAVLGDMLEMGDYTEQAHVELGKKVQNLSIDLLFTVGTQAAVVAESAIRHGFPKEKARVAESPTEVISLLKQVMKAGDWVLIKGSRGMAMERIVQGLTEARA
jgi:UDP-N-acetylmuramoyl-tripeptide--D-alanyl-D-alanine ligase